MARRKKKPKVYKSRKRLNIFQELIKLLSPINPRTVTQLWDGRTYIYNRRYMIASFRYYGGRNLYDLKLNTKNFIGHKFFRCMIMTEQYMEDGSKLRSILEERLPHAHLCNKHMRHAQEYSFLESALLDSDSEITITYSCKNYFNVELINVPSYISCSFRYLIKSGKVHHLWLRYSRNKHTIKLDMMKTPPHRREIFLRLIS